MRIWLPAVRAGSGADVFTLRLESGLRAAGHQPIVQWFPGKFEFVPWLLRAVRAPDRIDLVHAGSWQGFAFKRTGIPLVVTEHHYVRHPEFSRLTSPAQRAYHRLMVQGWLDRGYSVADEIVAVSNNTADALRADIKRQVSVVHNWIDTEEFRPAGMAHGEDEGRPFRILFVGNPSRRKGSDLLPDFARALGPLAEVWCLWGLRKKSDRVDLPSNLRTVPRVAPAQMPDLYRQVDAVVVPARYEAFGYVALEAMSSGLPVVGFDTTGTAEVCMNEETALLSPVDDLGSLVRNAKRLISSPELRRRLGAAGRRRALDFFSEKPAIEQYLRIYERARTQPSQR